MPAAVFNVWVGVGGVWVWVWVWVGRGTIVGVQARINNALFLFPWFSHMVAKEAQDGVRIPLPPLLPALSP